jgi:hypothetical protein
MTNKFTSSPPDQLIVSKLHILLQNINEVYQNGGTALDVDIQDLYNEALQLFFDSLDGSITGVTYAIKPGMPADPIDYNVFTSAISKDLQAMFYEVGTIDRFIGSNFNTIIALKNQLLSIARRVSSKVGDYLLYTDPSLGNGFFFGDSFNSSTYIDIGSNLLDTDECFLSQEEGIIQLPLDGIPERIPISNIVINSSSNGIAGNNHQLNVLPHSNIDALGDGEPDTWFEYERVSGTSASSPLILDFTVILNEVKVINHIHIDPVFFGTQTPVKISKIETSKDGYEYLSIKDEFPIADFLSEEEDDVFVLSGKSGKYYGEGKFSFLPRKAKFIHVILEQHTPYSIDTINGTRLRYAIGLKDINIYSRKFKTQGSIISTPISINGDATKVSIWASENPIEQSVLGELKHEISVDNGASWIPVQPQNRDEVLYPEILNFNNANENSKQTGGEVSSLRHKIVISRDSDAFTGDVTLKSEKFSTVDIVPIPGFSPFTLTLQNQPISETVNMYIPTLGSLSCPRANRGSLSDLSPPMDLDFIEFRIDNDTTGTIRFKLPWQNISNLLSKIRVFVNGEQWEYRSKSSDDLSLLDETSRVYFLNRGGRELQFVVIDSNGTNKGKLPGSGARIQICLDGDNPALISTDAGYTLSLLGSSDGNKDNVSIVTPTSLRTEVSTETVGEWEEAQITASLRSFNINQYIATLDSIKDSNDSGYISIGANNQNITTEEIANSSSSGMIPPVFDNVYSTGFQLIEYYSNNTIPMPITDSNRCFHNNTNGFYTDFGIDTDCEANGYVEFIDGNSEFYYTNPSSHERFLRPNRWTFDPYSGIVYFASSVNLWGNHRIVFKFKRRKFKILKNDEWNFYKNTVTGKTDLSKIVLSPQVVRQFPVSVVAEENVTSVKLVGYNDNNTSENIQFSGGHSWWKQQLVKGSIKFTTQNLIGENIKPIEVPFVDGKNELTNAVTAKYLLLSGTANGLISFTIPGIDSNHPLLEDVTFDPVIVYPEAIQSSQFLNRVDVIPTIISSYGDYYIDNNTGVVTILVDSPLITYIVKYRYEDLTSGIDKTGLYSVNYKDNIIYFSTPIAGGNITFNVTMYSVFYNMGEVISSGNIKKINETNHTIEIKPEYGIQFISDGSSYTSVPRYIRVSYDYYKKTTESLSDLEPYFSPICKDIAIKVITKDMIGEI